MKYVEVEYIESGSFQGGEGDTFLAGIKYGEDCICMSKTLFEKLKSALEKIANYEHEPIWQDDRDDAANEIVRIAKEAISDEEVRDV